MSDLTQTSTSLLTEAAAETFPQAQHYPLLPQQQTTANAPTFEELLSDSTANIPPPYSAFPLLQPFTSSQGLSAAADALMSSSATWKVIPGKKLGHMDFVPRIVQKRMLKEDLYDTQTDLVNRVNSWLEEHPGLQVLSCETITWFANQYKDIYSDVVVCSKLTEMFSKAIYLRGIRLWFLTDKIPKPNIAVLKLQTIQCETFLPRIKETFGQLIDRVIFINFFLGSIMKVEMVKLMVKDGLVSVEATHWEERAMEDVMFVWCVRVYSSLSEDSNKDVIGYQDFVPECLRKSRENGGFEVFSDLIDKTSRHLSDKGAAPHFEDRCKFTQRNSNQAPYLSIIRVFYLISKEKVEPSNILPMRISCKTFFPIITDLKGQRNFESVKLLVERINQWLISSGASLAMIETSSMMLMRDFRVPILGPECTFQHFPPEKESLKQLFFVRRRRRKYSV
ncbi:hypothetical protein HELRODRAFT_160401 [Helobdella robusta]|uniref:Uncharacterized protein n=1 Tax=Helobdella robusta TaxID=6412 RepID=T1EQ76_HELRO|nr:hypothetical protein HELRODRAFT_160401 [Helobdella robusta]ESO06243.1 hypothetical protein HELRODRAFT_160401 [Helobdella robusta]